MTLERIAFCTLAAGLALSAGVAFAADECPHQHGAAAGAGMLASMPMTTAPQRGYDEQQSVGGNKFPLPAGADAVPRDSAATAPTGKLAIKAVQGTPGGPAIVSTPVEVQLYHRGMLVETINTELDEHGVVMLEDLPLAMDIQPVVLVTYADLTYQKVGAVMDRMNPDQSIEVTCYELTDDEPQWKIRMRHVMLSPAPDGSDGLHVTEVMMVENLGDRTWAGSLRPGIDRPVTTAFTLPDGAMGVALGRGFHDWCCTTLAGRDGLEEPRGSADTSRHALLNHLPIMPGATEMIFSYIVPARRGTATIDITAPNAPGGIDQLMVLVPEQLQAASVTGLLATDSDQMGQTPVTRYTAAAIAPGETVSLTLAGLNSSADSALAAAGFAKTVAVIGVIVAVIGGLWLIFLKPVKKPAAAIGSGREKPPTRSFVGESI